MGGLEIAYESDDQQQEEQKQQEKQQQEKEIRKEARQIKRLSNAAKRKQKQENKKLVDTTKELLSKYYKCITSDKDQITAYETELIDLQKSIDAKGGKISAAELKELMTLQDSIIKQREDSLEKAKDDCKNITKEIEGNMEKLGELMNMIDNPEGRNAGPGSNEVVTDTPIKESDGTYDTSFFSSPYIPLNADAWQVTAVISAVSFAIGVSACKIFQKN